MVVDGAQFVIFDRHFEETSDGSFFHLIQLLVSMMKVKCCFDPTIWLHGQEVSQFIQLANELIVSVHSIVYTLLNESGELFITGWRGGVILSCAFEHFSRNWEEASDRCQVFGMQLKVNQGGKLHRKKDEERRERFAWGNTHPRARVRVIKYRILWVSVTRVESIEISECIYYEARVEWE